LLGVVGQEVVDHAVEQGGELVQRVRGPVCQGGLHAASAYLADAAGRCGARWGELDELGPAAVTLILMLATIAALRPGVRRRGVVLLLPAFVTTALVCWGFQGWLPTGPPFGSLMLSPLQWQDLVLVPVIGVAPGLIGLRLYERLLRRRAATAPADQASPPPG